MAIEVWVRNPRWFIREVLEVGLNQIIWDRGFLAKYNIDPLLFWTTYAGVVPHRTLVLDNLQAIELGPENDFDDPVAVYPAWQYGDDWGVLEDLCARNVAEDPEIRNDKSIPSHLMPRVGQEHRVVVTQIPNMQSGLGRAFIRGLRDLQAEYPDTIIHIHALYSYRYCFGYGFRSVDIDPYQYAKAKKVYLPNGKVVTYERAAEVPHWVQLLNMRPIDLKIPRQRCMFNMLSAVWASRYYRSTVKFATKRVGGPNAKVDETTVPLPVNHAIMVKRVKFEEGDKFLCDFCSIQNTCKYFRVGAVCALGDSDVAEFADQFDTRDAETIVDGLGALLRVQALRAAEAREEETSSGEMDPHLTKIIEGIFDRGLRLARFLTVPEGAGAPGVSHVTIGGTQITTGNPKELMAAIVQVLESRGVSRDSITPEMIRAIMGDPKRLAEKAIDVGVAERANDPL